MTTNVPAKLFRCFNLVRQVNHYYWTYIMDDVAVDPMYLPNLTKIISKLSDTEIQFSEFDTGATIIRGAVLRYPGLARILIRKSQTPEWKKFTAVKELCHVLLDTDEDFDSDPINTIDGLLQRPSILATEQSEAVRSESIAEMMAIELIYPIEMRRFDKDRTKAGESKTAIAQQRQVPIYVVELVLDDEYHTQSEGLWKELPTATPPELNWD